MAKTEDLLKDSRKNTVDLHQAGKTESIIGSSLVYINEWTVGTVVRKRKTYKINDTLPQSSVPHKISSTELKNGHEIGEQKSEDYM